jgi:DNA polymerase
MASAIYGKEVKDITKDERFIGKTTVLGAGYGMGAAKFQAQLKTMGVELDEKECQYIIRVYRKTYPAIQKLWWQTGDALEAMANNQVAPIGVDGVLEVLGRDGIRLPNGFRLKYPNLRFVKDEDSNRPELVYDTKKGKAKIKTRIYGGKCVENICQALARIIIGEQMLKVSRKYKVAMTVHDAVVAVVPVSEAEEGQAFVEECMRARPAWAQELPLDCESKVGVSYGG